MKLKLQKHFFENCVNSLKAFTIITSKTVVIKLYRTLIIIKEKGLEFEREQEGYIGGFGERKGIEK